eukprot:maker-scaffold100_size373717-snap-gene-2.54 protein:Tk05146 transcript:maker-scaffold100_size373717-snap-gene-2.54-mRNA-1 annotation:"hypothetical protein AJ90_08215"
MKLALACMLLVLACQSTSTQSVSSVNRAKRSPFFFGALRNFARRAQENQRRYVNRQVDYREGEINRIQQISNQRDGRRGIFGFFGRIGRRGRINSLSQEIDNFRDCGRSCCYNFPAEGYVGPSAQTQPLADALPSAEFHSSHTLDEPSAIPGLRSMLGPPAEGYVGPHARPPA